MPYSFKLSRRIARFRAPAVCALVLTFLGCSSTDSFDPSPTGANPGAAAQPAGSDFAAASFAGGIPFGLFKQPTALFGATYTGAKQTMSPEGLLTELAAIKAKGGRVVIMMAGSQSNYVDGSGHFSLTKWKARLDRFKRVNFSSYINDGTIIANYIIDEPQDAGNWKGVPISPATVDAMGQYSKQIWPGMPTAVRTEPRFFSSKPRYIDAAWAQYLARMGDPNAYLKRNVAEAQARGLALIVGLNVRYGGTPTLTAMSPTEVQTFGSALLSGTYPCAFISWQYTTSVMSAPGIGAAMQVLSSKAKSRPTKSCRAG